MNNMRSLVVSLLMLSGMSMQAMTRDTPCQKFVRYGAFLVALLGVPTTGHEVALRSNSVFDQVQSLKCQQFIVKAGYKEYRSNLPLCTPQSPDYLQGNIERLFKQDVSIQVEMVPCPLRDSADGVHVDCRRDVRNIGLLDLLRRQ